MDISVIVPCHNGAKYLPKLVNSLKLLLTSGVEVVFVDDGSTDGTRDVLKRFDRQPDVKIILLETNAIARARPKRGSPRSGLSASTSCR